jgi:hypothetical protein
MRDKVDINQTYEHLNSIERKRGPAKEPKQFTVCKAHRKYVPGAGREIDAQVDSSDEDSSSNEESINTPVMSNGRELNHNDTKTDNDELMSTLLPPNKQESCFWDRYQKDFHT